MRGASPFELAEGAAAHDDGLVLDGSIDANALDRALRANMFRIAERCMSCLTDADYIAGDEAADVLDSYRIYLEDLEPEEGILDILAFIVSIRLGSNDEKEVAEIRKLGQIVALDFGQKVPHCPFIQLTELPTALYESRPMIRDICRILMCPVVQVNETDFLTLTSVNPYTATLAGKIISGILERETGRKPFIFLLTTDANAWTWLRGKHFEK